MTPTLSLALACYVLVRLARVCLDDLEHGLTRALAALAALVAVVSIGTIAAQAGGARAGPGAGPGGVLTRRPRPPPRRGKKPGPPASMARRPAGLPSFPLGG